MKRQGLLDFGGERDAAWDIWRRLPPASRQEAIALLARLLAAAVQRRPVREGGQNERVPR